MKKKNGFMFIETMIVIVVVLVSLLFIYSSYVSLRSLERKRVRYDDPAFIYRTYAIGQFLLSIKDENSNVVIDNMMHELNQLSNNKTSNETVFKNITHRDNDWYSNDEYKYTVTENGSEVTKNYKQDLFAKIINNLNVLNIILINKKEIQTLNPNNSNIPNNFYDYIKTIDLSNVAENQYFLIIEYAEKVNGQSCDANQLLNSATSTNTSGRKSESNCIYYFSNLRIGG